MRLLSILVLAAAAPAAPAAAAPGARVFVSNEDTGEVAIIDAATDEVTTKLPVGKRPRGLRVSRDGKTLFVALSGSPKGGPGVDESKLPPPDRTADGIGIVDLGSLKLLRTL